MLTRRQLYQDVARAHASDLQQQLDRERCAHRRDNRRRNAVIGVLVVLAAILGATVALADTIHLKPGQSVQNAVSVSLAGDVIVLADGEYVGNLDVRTSGITLRAENQHKAVIVGYVTGGGTDVTLEGLVITRVRSGPQNEQAALRTNHRWRLIDVWVHHNSGAGVGVFGDDVMLTRVVSEHNGTNGIGSSASRRAKVIDCISRHNNRGVADPPWTGHKDTGGKPVAHRNAQGLWQFDPGNEGGGGKWANTEDLLIQGGEWSDNCGPGIWVDIRNRRTTIKGVRAERNVGLTANWQGTGICYEFNDGPATIEGNVTRDNSGAGIAVWESSGVIVKGNHLVNDGIELRAINRPPCVLSNVTIDGNRVENGSVFYSIKDRVGPNIVIGRNDATVELDGLPQGDPPREPDPVEPSPLESPAGTTVPPASRIVDAAGNVWTLRGGQIVRNGVVDAVTNGVQGLVYAGGRVYQTAHGKWWVHADGGWRVSDAPVIEPTAPEPEPEPEPDPNAEAIAELRERIKALEAWRDRVREAME